MNYLKKQNPIFKKSDQSPLEFYNEWESKSKNKEAWAEYKKLVTPLWNDKPKDFTSYLDTFFEKNIGTERKKKENDRKDVNNLASKSHTLVKKNKGTERKKKENDRKDVNNLASKSHTLVKKNKGTEKKKKQNDRKDVNNRSQDIIVIDDSDDDDDDVVFIDERPSKKMKL